LWHYQHFAPSLYPYAAPLALFYREGWRLVDLFFCLSGFVFFMNYESTINEGRISFKRFMLLRISRLYPLHLFTLILVTALQGVLFARTGAFRLYAENDLAHFIINLFMLQSEWLDGGFSFN